MGPVSQRDNQGQHGRAFWGYFLAVPVTPRLKFQDKWFTIGGAENKLQKEDKPAMHRITYKLNEDRSFTVTSTWLG